MTQPAIPFAGRTIVALDPRHFETIRRTVELCFRISHTRQWQERVDAGAPAHLRHAPGNAGVFMGYDFHLTPDDLYRTPGIVNLVRLMQVPDWVERPDLKYPPFVPGLPKALDKRRQIFTAIRAGDILLHHPFQSFAPVIEMLRVAADDPQVLAIKMTVYRTGTDSVLMEHLARAAQKGKEVTVVLDLIHVLEYLWKAAHCFHSAGSTEAEKWVTVRAPAG